MRRMRPQTNTASPQTSGSPSSSSSRSPEGAGSLVDGTTGLVEDRQVGLRARLLRGIKRLLLAGSGTGAQAWARQLTLPAALECVRKTFDVQRLLRELDHDSVEQYYRDSEWAYRLSHSASGCVHMAINPDGVFDPEGYKEQARYVVARAQRLAASQVPARVLEIGCGKGYNCVLVAAAQPHWQVVGLDRTDAHLQRARLAVSRSGVSHVELIKGDFNSLPLPHGSCGLVFAVECMCHALDSAQPLAEIFRVLAPGGECVIFDGWRVPGQPDVAGATCEEIEQANALASSAMSVQGGLLPLALTLQEAQRLGSEVVECEDLSPAVWPSMDRLQALVACVFRSGWRGWLLARLLPYHWVKNAVAGLLMPLICRPGGGSVYARVVLRKPA